MNRIRLLLVLAWLGSAAAAQPLVLNVMPATAPAEAASVAVELVAMNRGGDEQTLALPTALVAELAQGARTWRVELRALDEPPAATVVGPGSFVTRTYGFTPPAGVTGTAVLALRPEGFAAARGVVELGAVADAGSADSAGASAAARRERVGKPTTNLVRAEPAASIIQRTFAERLAPHEPVYFIYGAEGPAAKFQLSFKYQILRFTELGRERMARTLQFAFTQRSLWDLDGESSPFYDTSYMPELIYESLTPQPEERQTWFNWLGYQAGFKHESNGRDGPVSRSLNTVFVRPVFAFGRLDGWHLLVVPEAFAYVDTLEDNPDIKNYRGYGRLTVVLGKNDGPSLMATAWAGRDFNHPTVQLDFTYPIRTRLLNFETYLLVQYFNGFGESLLSYNQESETVRAGFSLVR